MSRPEVIATGGEPQRAPPPPTEVQKLFPHLEIVKVIGQGGMGAVYEAWQKGLNRRVALKILWGPEVADAEFEQRFAREGRALAQLAHPNIVSVHDAGQSGPYFWLVMEHVDGQDLRELILSGSLEPARALNLVMQMCAALDYAHRHGVVHRDIKPGNVLVTRAGRVKIADFGLAKILARRSHVEALTRSEQTMGTPHYVAPEQIERPKEVDHRADIYSLGVVLYEVLTGELPIGRFQMPSQKVRVDVRLDGIVVKALQKQPERRYQAVREVSTALQGLSKAPARARPRMLSPQRSGTTPVLLGVAGVALLALLGLGASKLGFLGTDDAAAALSPEKAFAEGQKLVGLKDLNRGTDLLEAAYSQAPELPGLRPALERALLQKAERSRSAGLHDEALRDARRAKEVAPSAATAKAVSDAEDLARRQWKKRVRVTRPAEDQVLSSAGVVLAGTLRDFPLGATLRIRDSLVLTEGDEFEHDLGTLDDGPHAIDLAVTTTDGLTIELPHGFTIDTRPPELAVESPRAGQVVGATLTVSGTASDATAIRITIGDEELALQRGGPWSMEVALDEGAQELAVVATDALGQPRRVSIPLVVDTTPPTIVPPGGGFDITWSVLNDVLVRVTDAHGIDSVTWDGRSLPTPDADGMIKLPTDFTAVEGVKSQHILWVRDTAGNEASKPFSLSLDKTAPSIAPQAGEVAVFPDSKKEIRGTFSDASQCHLLYEGKEVPLEGKEYVLHVAVGAERRPEERIPAKFEIRDAAGNRSPAERMLKVVAPCTSCKPIDGSRGDCLDCNGTGNKDRRCSKKCNQGKVTGDCQECGGHGKAWCDACGGSARGPGFDCSNCEGGQAPCELCGGIGRRDIKCQNRTCDGSGKVPNDGIPSRMVTCGTCKGDGLQNVICKGCEGNKHVKCGQCETGIAYPSCGYCTDGHSKALCDGCTGQGKTTADCSHCEAGVQPDNCPTCKGKKKCKACGGSGAQS